MLFRSLVIALTFFRASLGDMKTAENTVNGVRAELLADGATAVAIGFLNHDRLVHPAYSSLDHAWRTYFNGAWAVGKPWMWASIEDTNLANGVHRLSLLRGGVPEIDPLYLGNNAAGRAINGAPTDAIYIPREDYQFDATNGLLPWIAPAGYGTFDGSGALQNPFVTTGDLADPTQPGKFPSIEAMYSDPALQGLVIFQEDLDQLETTVYDEIAPGGRFLSLKRQFPTTGFNNETLPSEQIDFFTDVDNDGDSLKEDRKSVV